MEIGKQNFRKMELPKNVLSIVSTNAKSVVSINSQTKKNNGLLYCYILFFLVNILLFKIAIIFYHYPKHRSKEKNFEEK